MSSGPSRSSGSPLRIGTRLTLWGTLISLSVCAIVCVVLYAALDMLLHREVDGFLEGEVQEFLVILREEGNASLDRVQDDVRRELSSRPRSDLTFRLLDLTGKLILSSDPHDPLAGDGNMDVSSVPGDHSLCFDTIATDEPHRSIRVCSQRTSLLQRGDCIAQATYLLDNLHASLATFRAFCLGALGFAAGLSVIGGRILARKSLHPVQVMATAARRIGGEDLSRRLLRNGNGDELDHLAAVLNEMLERIEAMFLRIQRFTADAAHELRTPLAALRGNAEVALCRNSSDEDLRNVLEEAIDTYDRLSRIADDLLLLARADTGHDFLQPEPFHLNTAVSDVADFFAPLAQERGVSLEWEDDGAVELVADSSRIRQVLSNLLDNAIKYTPAGGRIRISITVVAGMVKLTVSDTGSGIKSEHLPHVFDRFYRADAARSRGVGGSGLGLAICRTIAQAHGGTIDITSDPGEGTTITVSLPLSHQSAAQPVGSQENL